MLRRPLPLAWIGASVDGHWTYPNHHTQLSLPFPAGSSLTFWLLSLPSHTSILSSTLIIWTHYFWTAQYFIPHSMVSLIVFLQNPPFNSTGIWWSQNKLDTLLHFKHHALVKEATWVPICPSLWTIVPRQKNSLPFGSLLTIDFHSLPICGSSFVFRILNPRSTFLKKFRVYNLSPQL